MNDQEKLFNKIKEDQLRTIMHIDKIYEDVYSIIQNKITCENLKREDIEKWLDTISKNIKSIPDSIETYACISTKVHDFIADLALKSKE